MAKTGGPVAAESKITSSIPLQVASEDIWAQKYRLTNKDGTPVDDNVDATWQRVARALADVEPAEQREHWHERFLWALRNGAIPAGRIISNAGAQDYKPATSTINCTVSGTITDSMDDILGKVHEAGLTLKAGCGIGYEFSTLRPRGSFVSGAGAHTSGPLSFMDIFDKMCFTVSSAGGRRGAQMGTFEVGHPDVREFIRAKREDGRLRQFNLSLLITDEFMQAVEADGEWPLVFPVHAKEAAELDLSDAEHVLWREWPVHDNYIVRDDGLVACKIYGRVKARHLWDMIMVSTYDYAEPGFILIDRVNQLNNNWWCEAIRATNPCGEQPLPPYGSCLLGSVNLTSFVIDPFGAEARFDWDKYREVVRIFTRMLDNVVEINGLPLDQQRHEIETKRRHGMGFLGLGSTLTLLKLRYGSPEACVFTEEVAREMALVGWEQALELSREKGPAPLLSETFTVTADMLRKRPEMARDGYKVGDQVAGRVLHAKYSRYMQKIAEYAPELIEALATEGARFSRVRPRADRGAGHRRRALHSPQLHRADRHHQPEPGQQCLQRHRAELRASLLAQPDPHRAQGQGKDRGLQLRAAGLSHADQRARQAGLRRAGREAAGLLHHRRRRYSDPARRHPGCGAEVGRLVDLQDRQRADRLSVRVVQGHLPLRLASGPEGLHHLPLQPGGVPGRAGQGSRSGENPVSLHPRGRQRGRTQR